MRRVRLWLGALLCVGMIVIVIKRDDPVQERALRSRARPEKTMPHNARMVNWTNAAERFRDGVLISRVVTNVAATNVLVEVVKTRSKFPYIRVETPFTYDLKEQAWAADTPAEYVADQVLVRLKTGATDFTKALEEVQGRVVQKHPAGDSTLVLLGLAKPTVEAVPEAISRLEKFPELFAVVEPHFVRRQMRTPNDPRFSEQWALQNIQAEAAWDIQRGNNTVVVAVLDSGIDYYHPDLASRAWINPGEVPSNRIDDDRNGFVDDYRGINLAYGDSDPYDDQDHGTFVSGLIGAAGNNGLGISGVCWNVRIMPVKVINFDGLMYGIDFIMGMDYARREGAKIINASFGGAQFSQSEYEAISRLRSAGVLMAAAAGNFARNNDLRPVYPASYPHDNIIAVTYSDVDDNFSPNANFGPTSVDLAAPGVDVTSTLARGGYTTARGSSFAVPHVVAVAALLKAQNPNRSYASIRSALLSNTDRVPSMRGRTVTGGRLNAYEALIPRVPLAQALDAGSLTWRTGGGKPWFGQTLMSTDGIDAARCGNIIDNETSWIDTTVTGPGVLWFDWRVSSEPDADFLIVAIDGNVVSYISGDSGWQTEGWELPEGTHTLAWSYDKDYSVSAGEDKGWLDQILYLRDTGGPAITITAPTGTYLYATDALLEGTASDVLGVASLEFRVLNANGAGPWQSVTTTDSFATWQAPLSGLALGTNLVRFRAVDTLGQATVLDRTYVVLSPLTINVAGCGSVPARFAGSTWQEAGKTLKIVATPCPGHLFTHWSGDTNSSNAVLKFVMQPNLTFQANFVVNPFATAAGAFNGLFHEAAGVLHESSGLLRLSLTDTGAFNGTMTLDGATYSFASRFDPVTSLSSFFVPRAGRNSLQLSLRLEQNDLITGQISEGPWTADLIADRKVFDGSNPAPFAGMYTLVFPGAADFTSSPAGHGYATATLDAQGRVSVDGRLADNSRVRQTIPVSVYGDWPFYVPLYGGMGSALGWLKFLSPPGLTNQLMSWIRPTSATAGYYPDGFSNQLVAAASPYVPPATGRVIDCTNALLILSGADFVEPITNQFALTKRNVVVNLGPYNASMTIVPTNGTFSGSIVFPARTTTFRGVFLQQQKIGLGYFLGSNHVGAVRFEPAP